ncbi:universal stress protein [Brucella sp. 10RB9214]|uniref:universal stress protein n=1 Tax=unclassified Brucella TaxID=2632610 RepID=UPI0009729FE7|nr:MULTISPECIES: universal stress protein [unclassified Brucella]APY14827.1 universal stress protein [Brucella sp. 09RB8910]MRN47953.1 universal stress protein [Brucella sp. 10RB9212]MRN50479.1 universal stress protein [Brucella sp. 10RB9214]UWF59782.1 universal stress protein [Brucella sp. 2716]
MSYKTVVAYSRSEAELKRVLSAIGLLRQKVPDIHVIGLYAIPSPIVYADPNGFIDPGMFELHDKQHKELSERLKHVFEEEMRRQGINYEFRVTRSDTGTAADGVLASCLGAELLIAGQPDPNDPATNDETADTIVFNASCPVLLVPYAPVLPMISLDRIVVAFNGKREAARAAFDALPLIKQAARTEIIWIDPPEAEGEDETLGGSELAEALARHGVEVEVLALASHGRHAQDALREHLIAERADLLVMGAYSHSRLRELVFGGVTRSLLNDLPILTLFAR